MIIKNVVPQDVMAAIEDYVSNAIAANLPEPKAYCVFSDAASETVTSVVYPAVVLGCNLSKIIGYGNFISVTNGIKYTGTESINVVINVVLSGIDLSGNDTPAFFYIYKNGQVIVSTSSLQVVSAYGSTFSILCGTSLSQNDQIKVYAAAINGGDNFNFELNSINISITQVS